MGGRDEQRDRGTLSETRAGRFRTRLPADLPAWPRVAFGLGLAWWRGQLLFADDQRCLCGPRHFSDCGCKESCRKPQPDFLYDLVERRARGNHGGAIYDSREHGHLVGDVPALLLVAAVLWLLSPKGERFIGATA